MLDGDDGPWRDFENRRGIFGLLASSAGIKILEAEHPDAVTVHDGWDALCTCWRWIKLRFQRDAVLGPGRVRFPNHSRGVLLPKPRVGNNQNRMGELAFERLIIPGLTTHWSAIRMSSPPANKSSVD